MTRPEVLGLLPPLGGLDVVDLGCGTGAFVRTAALAGAASVLGLDLDDDLLDVVRREFDSDDRVHVEQSDLDQVTLRFASYDLAHSDGALADVTEPLRFFRVVNAGLRPGGRLVLTYPRSLGFGPILTALARARLVLVELVEAGDLVVVSASKPLPGVLPH